MEHRAALYFPHVEARSWHAAVVSVLNRPAGAVLMLRLTSDVGVERRVVVKLSDRTGLLSPGTRRPRLFPVGASTIADHALEFRALSAIEEAVSSSEDPGLGYVRALDHLPTHGALVMEHVGEPSLASLLRRHAVRPRTQTIRQLGPVFRNLGAWLRIFRGLPLSAPPNRGTRAQILETADGYFEHLERSGCDRQMIAALRREFRDRATSSLPDELDMGLVHTDFAPRNVFVGNGGRVTVFDTLGCWRAPTLEDPAYLLTSVQTAGLPLASRGVAGWWLGIERLGEQMAAAAGLGDPSSSEMLATYRVLLILDRWAALTELPDSRVGRATRGRDRFLSWAIRRLLRPPRQRRW